MRRKLPNEPTAISAWTTIAAPRTLDLSSPRTSDAAMPTAEIVGSVGVGMYSARNQAARAVRIRASSWAIPTGFCRQTLAPAASAASDIAAAL